MVEGLKDSRNRAEIQAECSHVYWIGNMCTWQEKKKQSADGYVVPFNEHTCFLSSSVGSETTLLIAMKRLRR